MHQRRYVANRTNVDLAARQESNGTIKIDCETAFDLTENNTFNAFTGIEFFFQTNPALFTASFFA